MRSRKQNSVPGKLEFARKDSKLYDFPLIPFHSCGCFLEPLTNLPRADRGDFALPRRISSLGTVTLHPIALMSRSFNGCTRCKARRQKCDEQRPICGRCQTAGVQCKYAMQLQWGGRAFSRSRFGACVGTGGMQRLGIHAIIKPDNLHTRGLTFSRILSRRIHLHHQVRQGRLKFGLDTTNRSLLVLVVGAESSTAPFY